jgi:tRNA threonylcarbamoyladenosine biosynthesis protein TsaE
MQTFPSLTSASEEQTLELGRRLGGLLEPGHVVGLVGELGAGKTCLARGAALGLHVPSTIYVSSPTFTLVNEYPGRITLYHIDLYRLGDTSDLVEIGLQDCYRGGGACLVEWFDRFPDEGPAEHLELRLVVTGETTRRLDVHAFGEAHARLARSWTAPQQLTLDSSAQ